MKAEFKGSDYWLTKNQFLDRKPSMTASRDDSAFESTGYAVPQYHNETQNCKDTYTPINSAEKDGEILSFSETNSEILDSPICSRQRLLCSKHRKEPTTLNPTDGSSAFLKFIQDGTKVGLPDHFRQSLGGIPPWFDPKKYQLGQQFGQKFFFGINFSEMLSLYLLFLPKRALEPLIFFGNTHTPYKAFKRYLNTALMAKTWYESDIFDPNSTGHHNLRTVRALHLDFSRKLNTCPQADIKRFGTMTGEPGKYGVWCPSVAEIKNDLKVSCPFSGYLVEAEESHLYFSQHDMSITQFGFAGLILLYPEKFGASSATEEDLEGFAHLWRCIGYLPGTEDEFNFFQGTLPEIRLRCVYTIDLLMKPRFRDVGPDWEHMSRCMAEGISYVVPGIGFEVSFSYLCWVLDIQVPSVLSKLSIFQSFMLHLMKLFFCSLSKIPAVLSLNDFLLKSSLENARWKSKE